MLIRHDVVFVLRIRRLVLRGHVDGFVREVGAAGEFFEEVGVEGVGEVEVGVGRVFGLGESPREGGGLVGGKGGRGRREGEEGGGDYHCV